MTAMDIIKLTVTDRAHSYARIYASLLQDEFQRKRSYASIVALYSFLDKIEESTLKIQSSMTLFRHPMLNEKYEISDLYVNNWHLDVRVVVNGDYVLIPKVHQECGITPDFYVVVKVDTSLKNAELLGFIDAKNANKEAFDYHYDKVANDTLIGYEEFLSKVHSEKTVAFSEEEHELFSSSYLAMIDDELDTETKNKVLKHLFECSACRTEFCCFTGFEMVSINTSKYPEVLEDHTLGFIGAQNVDEQKYEGKEETIYIGDDPEEKLKFEEEKQNQNNEQDKQQDDEQDISQNEGTVTDILDELFSIDEGTIELEPLEDKPADSELLEFLNDEKVENSTQEENIENENSTETTIDGEDFVIIEPEDNNKKEDTLLLFEDEPSEEIITDINDEEELIIKEENTEIDELDNEIIDEATMLSQDDGIQQVIVDYDNEGEPVYSYITDVEKEDDSEIANIVEIEDIQNIQNAEDIKDIKDIEEVEEIEEIANPVNESLIEEIDSDIQKIEYIDDAQAESEITTEIQNEFDIEYEEFKSRQELEGEEVVILDDDDVFDEEYDNGAETNVELENFDPERETTVTDDMLQIEDAPEEINQQELETETDDTDEFEDNDAELGTDEEFEDYEDYDVEEYLPEEQIKKSSTTPASVIISIIVFLILAGGVGAFIFNKNTKNNDSVIENYNENSTPIAEEQVVNDMFEQPVTNNNQVSEQTTKQPPVQQTVPTSQNNTVSVPELTEDDLIKPKKVQKATDVNSALVNAFSKNVPVTMKALNWFCAPDLYSNNDFKLYLQAADNTLKQNIKNNLMNLVDPAPKNSVSAKFAIDKKGNLKKVIISESSGSSAIDDVVLQSINETFQGQNAQNLNNSGLKEDIFYLKVVIKL